MFWSAKDALIYVTNHFLTAISAESYIEALQKDCTILGQISIWISRSQQCTDYNFVMKHTDFPDTHIIQIIHSPRRGPKARCIIGLNSSNLFCWIFSILMAVSSCFFGFTQRTRDNWSNSSKPKTDCLLLIPLHSSSVTTFSFR